MLSDKTTQKCLAQPEAQLAGWIASDLRAIREAHGSTLEEISGSMGHEKNWLSRIERGKRRISVAEYLLIVRIIGEIRPDHPAGRLLDYLSRGGAGRRKGA